MFDFKNLNKPLNVDTLKSIYYKMLLARLFEEKIAYFFSRNEIHGTTHLSVGQEASAVASCEAIKENDYMSSTHRGHAHSIGRGMSPVLMMCEMFGRSHGYCKGKGGSMHIADLKQNNLGANGVVAGGIPISVGAALSIKMQAKDNMVDRIVLCFFGDGASNEGAFHESLNMASIWKLPIIFMCENNSYAMSMSIKESMNIDDIAIRASSYGIKGLSFDGNDTIAVYNTVSNARKYVLNNGPILLVSNTYRTKGHSKSDANRYRTKDEIKSWEAKDPIVRLYNYLINDIGINKDILSSIQDRAFLTIEEAVAIARASPEPSLESLYKDVYSD